MKSIIRIVGLFLIFQLSACIPRNVPPPISFPEKTEQVQPSQDVEVLAVAPTTENLVPTSTPAPSPIPSPTPVDIPEDQVYWRETIPTNSPRAICPAVKDLHEQTIIDSLNLKDEYLVYYSVNDAFEWIPPGGELFSRSQRDPCIRFGGNFPPGEYYIRYHASIYMEYSKYVDSSSHTLLTEVIRYLQLTVLPPVDIYEDLIAYSDVYLSEDGQTLAGGLSIIDPSGTKSSELEHRVASPVTTFVWSPNKDNIAFAAGDGLYMVDILTKTKKELARTGDMIFWPAWSPDGNSIAFINQHPFEGVLKRFGGLMVFNADTNAVKMLGSAGDQAIHPAWSPDGNWIAFTSILDENPTSANYANSKILLIDPDSTTLLEMASADQFSEYPVWSPDSQRIAFIKSADICVMDNNGNNFINLTNTPDRYDYLPVWADAGNSIIFVSRSMDLEYQLTSLDLINRNMTVLHTFSKDQPITSLSWNEDARELVIGFQLEMLRFNIDTLEMTNLGNGTQPAWR